MNAEQWENLRIQAKTLLEAGESSPHSAQSTDVQALLEELQVSYVELELQNRELQDTQAILEDLTREYSDLFDYSPVGKAAIDPSGRILKANLSLASSVRLIRAHLQGKNITNYFPVTEVQSLHEHLRRARSSQQPISWKTWLKAGKEERIPVIVQARQYVSTKGESQIYMVFMDISDQVRAEEERVSLEQRLQQSKAMESLGHFSSGIAHDFNNILASVAGFAELLEDHVQDAKARSFLEKLQSSADRGRALVERILTFSRHTRDEIQGVCLRQTLQNTLGHLGPQLSPDIQVEYQDRGPLPLVRGQESQVDQVLSNLILNARDAIRNRQNNQVAPDKPEALDPGIIRIHLEELDLKNGQEAPIRVPGLAPGLYVHFLLEDNGCGMSDEVQNHIFDPFYTTKIRQKGTGLGLFTVYGILQSVGAQIITQSREAEGTVFHIFWPAWDRNKGRSDQEKTSSPQTAAHGPEQTDPGQFLRGRHLLLVDDEDNLVEILERHLEKAGAETRSFLSAEQAQNFLEQNPHWPQALITDQNMATHKGEQLIARARELQPGLPCILCTGLLEGPALDSPSEEYRILKKPFGRADLYKVLRESLD